MVPVRREGFHSQETVWHLEMDWIKSSTHLTAAVCLVFSVNFTVIYWWENSTMDAKIDIFLERRTNSILYSFKWVFGGREFITNEPIIQVCPKLHTQWLTEAWFIAGCGHWRCFCASSGETCHFLHTELLIGPLCISNEANVAATKVLLQSCGENGICVCARQLCSQSALPVPRTLFSSPQFALCFPHSSSPLSLPWPYCWFYLSPISCTSFRFHPQATRRQKKLF